MQKKLSTLVKKFLNKSSKREETTRKYTRVMIKKYGKTLKRLSYE